ncbi:MAG: hypothetical protein HQL43_04245 [Alphaproteobacteria bacterium]|nr:hypothetical protein [Alphaproteobacteria bacterium]
MIVVLSNKFESEWRLRLGRLRQFGEEQAVADILFDQRSLLPERSGAIGAPLLSRRALVGRARVASGGGERFPGKTQAVVKCAGKRYSARGTLALRSYVTTRDGITGCIQLYDEYGQPLVRDQAKCKIRDWPEGSEENAIHSWHVIFSLPSRDIEADSYRFRQVCRKTIDAIFTEEGYEALWGIHKDKPGHLHAHIILCAQGQFGRKWRFDKHGDMFDTMRSEFAYFATMAGFQVNATRREDRAKVRERIVNGDEPLRTTKTYLAWKDGDGRPELRVPNWFKKYGNPAAKPEAKSTWLQRVLNIGPSPQRQTVADTQVIEMFTSVYRDPVLAVESFAFMSQESADWKYRLRQRPSRFALWNLKNRPELFGALKNEEAQKRRLEALVRYAKRLTVPSAHFEPLRLQHSEVTQIGQIMQNRRAVQASLNRLADNDEAINLGDSRAIIIRREVQRIGKLPLPSSSKPVVGIIPAPMAEVTLPLPKPKRLAESPPSSGGGEGKGVEKSPEAPAPTSPSRKQSRRRSFDRDMD